MLTYILNEELTRAVKQGNFKIIAASANANGLTLIVQNVVTEKCLRLRFDHPSVSEPDVDLIGLTFLGAVFNRFTSIFKTKYFDTAYAVLASDDKKTKVVIRGGQQS